MCWSGNVADDSWTPANLCVLIKCTGCPALLDLTSEFKFCSGNHINCGKWLLGA